MELLSDELFKVAQPVWDKSVAHPFVVHLAKGDLDKERFCNYMTQDYLYLMSYIKIFGIIMQKTQDIDEIKFASDNIAALLDETIRVHIPYMKRLGITDQDIQTSRAHPDNLAYTSYMAQIAAQNNYLAGLIAILGCSWGYAYIAQKATQIYPQSLSTSPYRSWFASYIHPSYVKTNQDLIDRCDDLAQNIGQEEKEKLIEIFYTCCVFEYRFWNMLIAHSSVLD